MNPKDKNINHINTFDEFKKFYDKQIFSVDKKFIFRGQSNFDGNIWKLTSSLNRELLMSNDLNNGNVFDIEWINSKIKDRNCELINYFHKKDSNTYIDLLRTLSNLQHNGYPTLLIDFTNSLDVALWFALYEVGNYEGYIRDYNKQFSTLFIKEIKDKDINYNLTPEDFENDVEKIFVCPPTNQRGLSQRSYFIIDNSKLNETNIEKVNISHSLKTEILLFLDSRGINAEVLFPGIEGISKKFLNEDLNTNFLKFKSSVYGHQSSSHSFISLKYYENKWNKDPFLLKELYFLKGEIYFKDFVHELNDLGLFMTPKDIMNSDNLINAFNCYENQIKNNLLTPSDEVATIYLINSKVKIFELIFNIFENINSGYEEDIYFPSDIIEAFKNNDLFAKNDSEQNIDHIGSLMHVNLSSAIDIFNKSSNNFKKTSNVWKNVLDILESKRTKYINSVDKFNGLIKEINNE